MSDFCRRLTAVRWRPAAFFAGGWNTFDFVVVTASYVPGLNASLLRIVRLGRVVRVVRFLPDLRVIVSAVARSVPGVASLAVGTALLVYVYGMIGWLIFDEHDAANFGNGAQAMLTMFVLLTLENLPTYIEKDHRAQREEERRAAAASEDPEDDMVVAVEDRIDELRAALDALSEELADRQHARRRA